ncbi:hypothetical protein QQ045_015829 [Rhodiola kirilowii]
METDVGKIKEIISVHYKQLFQSSTCISPHELHFRLSCLNRKVTDQHNAILLAPYTAEEVTPAVFQLHPMKSPGMDGFNAAFVQRCWSIIKDEFITDCLSFLNDGIIPIQDNVTMITLIPKRKGASKVSDYRPISLIGTKMKVISKQCAFVKNRLITDNLIIAHEVIHYIKNTRAKKAAYGSLKLDIAKAYDTVDWIFLENILHKLGFAEVWVHRVMQIVTSVTYYIRVNDSCTEQITPRRGIRQGDPLSPYLFILCTEFFTALLNHYNRLGLIDGVKICCRAPAISHLLFADDSLLFLKLSYTSLQWIKEILYILERTSGLRVNLDKSEIMVSKNTHSDLIAHIHQILGVKVVTSHAKYLGLATVHLRNSSQMFQTLTDKMWSKTRSWQAITLSQGGKHVLIQAVLNAIPQYWFSCFLLPEKVVNKLHSIISDYWWCHTGKKRLRRCYQLFIVRPMVVYRWMVNPSRNIIERSMAGVIFYVYTSSRPDDFCKVMVAFWYIWHHRNRVCHGSASISPFTAAIRISKLHKDYTSNNKALIPNVNNSSLEWQKPVGNYVKFNCDGAWSECQQTGGIGIILRDSTGVVLAIRTTFSTAILLFNAKEWL